MEINFQDRPSDEAVEHYRKKLEEFLSAHNVSIKIELRKQPIRIDIFTNGEPTDKINLWVRHLVLNGENIDPVTLRPVSKGIKENEDEEEIWLDAWKIQRKLYKHLGKASPPRESNDPYWELSKCHPRRKGL